MNEQRQFLSNSKVMAVMTLCSRFFGFGRDMLIAFLLGTSRIADIWAFSFMLPNLFRRLIAEGAMTSAFVPLLSELEEAESEAVQRDFSRAMFSMVLCAVVILVTLMVCCLPMILPSLLRLLAPAGVQADGRFAAMVVDPARWMFPYLGFISLAAVCQGILNVRNRYALAAATPILLNVAIIVCGYSFREAGDSPIWGLIAGVLCGGFLQFFLQWAHLYRLGLRLWPTRYFWSRRTKEAVRLWLPTTFGAGIVQINAFISTGVAVNLVEGAAISLFNATRLNELVLGVFTASFTTALLPVLSRQRSRKDHEGLERSLWNGLTVMSLVSVPASVGLMVSGPALITVLFKRGSFDELSVILTASALLFQAMALLPISWYRILSQSFFAHKRVGLTVRIAVIAAVVNIIGCFVLPSFFSPQLNHCGIALATLISSWVLFALALYELRRHFGLQWPSRLTRDLGKIILATVAFLPLWWPFRGETLPLWLLAAKMVGSVVIFAVVVWLLRVSALELLIPRLKRKKGTLGS